MITTELIEELRNTFDYHPAGYLIRKKNGKPCGQRSNHPTGYAQVSVGGKKLYAHRIIYAIAHGTMPKGQIDHVNGNRVDNRIENLRDVSSSENNHNRKMNKNNSSGFPGVYWSSQHQKWRAYIKVDYQRICLGIFDNFADAVKARKMAKIKYHPSSPEAIKYISEDKNMKMRVMEHYRPSIEEVNNMAIKINNEYHDPVIAREMLSLWIEEETNSRIKEAYEEGEL